MQTFVLIVESILNIAITLAVLTCAFALTIRLRKDNKNHSTNKISFDLINDSKQAKESINELNLPSFDDIAGLSEVKQDIKKILEVFKDNNKFKDKGAVPPSGILFYGPPGCGKTMLAKAIARECGVNFICRNAGELVDNGFSIAHEGSALSRAFDYARKNKPCILYIDELDIFGNRNNVIGGRRELTELIAEMDGMTSNDGVLIIGATNNLYALDEALLRSGRFTKKYSIGFPESNDDIKELLDMYCERSLMHEELTDDDMIRLCRGISPSDIKSMFQIVQTEAVTDDRLVRQVDLMRVKIELLSNGKQRLTSRYSKDELDRRVAIHEVGHVILNNYFDRYLEGVNILGLADTLGITVRSLEEGEDLKTVRECLEQVCINYGGAINEYLYYGRDMKNVSLGCENDIRVATNILKHITFKVSLLNSNNLLLDYNGLHETHNLEYSRIIEELAAKCKEITEDILDKNKDISDKLVEMLLNKNEISSIELEKFFKENKLNRSEKQL